MNATQYQQWLVEAGLAEDVADRMSEDLAAVESPDWMRELSVEELYALAFGEEITTENDEENKD